MILGSRLQESSAVRLLTAKGRVVLAALMLMSALALVNAPRARGDVPECIPSNTSTSGGITTLTFDTGGCVWTVPSDPEFSSVTIEAYGGQGGGNSAVDCTGANGLGGKGGKGATTVSVTGDETFELTVGSMGFDGCGEAGGDGGSPGGGYGGSSGVGNPDLTWGAGGGGGYSDVRSDGNLLVVGGGGGGSGGNACPATGAGCGVGGDGGGTAGSPGENGAAIAPFHPGGGGGGTQSSPGSGGVFGFTDTPSESGENGSGSAGGPGGNGYYPGGGGGGGGYFGGGGGGSGHRGAGGGGGSSFGDAVDSGVQIGNGKIVVTYQSDFAAPTSTITFPADNAAYTDTTFDAGCTTTGFCGTSADAGVAVDKVELSILEVATGMYWSGTAFDDDASNFVEATGTDDWSYAFSASSFPTDGSYTVHARATDELGNVEASPTATFTIDNTAPTSTISFPVDAAAYGTASFNAGCTTPGFCGTSTDTDVQKVELSILDVANNRYWNATTEAFDAIDEIYVEATGTDSWSYAFSASSFPADGSYTVHARATDDSGNVEASPMATFTIDTTGPDVVCAATPTFVWGGSGGNVSANVTDTGSGPAASPVSAAADVSSVGKKSASLTGSDNAGNATPQSCDYIVRYNVLGYTLDGTSVRHGGTIKFTFQLGNASNVLLSKAAAQALLQSPCKARARLDAQTPVCATYAANKQTFTVTIKTSRTIPVGPHTVTLEILAGSDIINAVPATVTVT